MKEETIIDVINVEKNFLNLNTWVNTSKQFMKFEEKISVMNVENIFNSLERVETHKSGSRMYKIF